MSNQKLDYEVKEVYNSLVKGENCKVIDVREYPEYANARIAQASLIPLRDIVNRANELDRSLPIYLICRSGKRSKEAQEKLLGLGFTNVGSVIGGMVAWQTAGLPIEREQKAPWSLERQVRFVAGLMVLVSSLLSFFVAQSFIFLAVFVGAGLTFAAITDTCAMAMLLARMPWNKAKEQKCSIEGKLQRG